jgi:hypothetical protein
MVAHAPQAKPAGRVPVRVRRDLHRADPCPALSGPHDGGVLRAAGGTERWQHDQSIGGGYLDLGRSAAADCRRCRYGSQAPGRRARHRWSTPAGQNGSPRPCPDRGLPDYHLRGRIVGEGGREQIPASSRERKLRVPRFLSLGNDPREQELVLAHLRATEFADRLRPTSAGCQRDDGIVRRSWMRQVHQLPRRRWISACMTSLTCPMNSMRSGQYTEGLAKPAPSR